MTQHDSQYRYFSPETAVHSVRFSGRKSHIIKDLLPVFEKMDSSRYNSTRPIAYLAHNFQTNASEVTFLRINNNNKNFSTDVLYFVGENRKKCRNPDDTSGYLQKFRFPNFAVTNFWEHSSELCFMTSCSV